MKSKRDLSLSQFEVFIIVSQTKSFTVTAQYLGITKAAVSHSIKVLERETATPLLIRTTRSVYLTQEGEMFLSQCIKLKDELDAARDLVKGFHNNPEGNLKISCNPMLAESLLIPKVMKYKRLYPSVNLEIKIEERIPDIRNEKIDLVFGINWPAPDDIIARKIYTTRYVLCASRDYLKQKGTPQTLTDLKSHQYIHHSNRDRNSSLVSLKENNENIKLTQNFKSNSISFIKSCVLSGVGISQFHDYVVKKEIEDGKLVEILPSYFKNEEPVFIYYQKHRLVQPKIKELIRVILE